MVSHDPKVNCLVIVSFPQTDDHYLCMQPDQLIPIQKLVLSVFSWKEIYEFWDKNNVCEKCIELFKNHFCTQYPLCYSCSEFGDINHRICPDCYRLEWDEKLNCIDDDIPLSHNCKGDYWYCEGSYCLAEQQQSEMHEYAIEKAGGLDEVQRQEKLRYYGEE